MKSAPPRAEMLFEVSWEVCNKVGGIHTVIQSKLAEIHNCSTNYLLIGPLLGNNSKFEEREPPVHWREIMDELQGRGVRSVFGVWLTAEEPEVLLVDGSQLDENELKKKIWEEFQIDSMNASHEFDEPLQFATAAGIAVELYANRNKERIVLQCHEWMAGFALLHCINIPNVATVFTTHATILGRTIMGNGYQLYEIINDVNPSEWAYRFNIQDKHLAEVACAKYANVFTTVSEITGKEAEKLLGRKPDVLLFNGFSTERFPTFEETSIKHNTSREALKELVAYIFFPHYAFDLDNTLFFFTSGRYEFQNKGIDVLIEALGELNKRLKEEESEKTIVMFFWLLMGRHQVKLELLEKKNAFYHIKSYVEWQSKPLMQKMIFDFMSGHRPGEKDVFTSDYIKNLQRNIRPVRLQGAPPILTHEIDNAAGDPTLKACHANNLNNREEDKVKVLFYPGNLDGTDGLLHMDYYDTTVGTHLGIFPSHYEPWGYTPLESAVLGIPAVTTDLAGFGRYVKDKKGIFVVPREGRSQSDVVKDLVEVLRSFVNMTHEERVQQGFAAKTTAASCDWKCFIGNYVDAHNLSLERRGV